MNIDLLTNTHRFLLVSLSIDTILKEATLSNRMKKLKQMSKGDGLGDVYADTLRRMKAQDSQKREFGMKALMWVAHSERPLRASELRQALGVEIGSIDLDPESGPAIQTLLGWSLGLITLEKSTATVRLVHFTLRDHLANNPVLLGSPHSVIAEICLTYLHFKSVCELPSSRFSDISAFPFLHYASCYWERHARRDMTQNVENLVLGLLDKFGQHISSRMLLTNGGYRIRLWERHSEREWNKFKGFTCLHWTASLGMLEMTRALLEMKEWDLNATDATGSTAIALAARGGHTDFLKELSKQKYTNPNTTDKHGRTFLSWAAWQGNKEIVNILLERKDISLDPVDCDGRTPLLWAISRGHEEVAKLLLERKDAAFGLKLNGGIPAAFLTKLDAPASNTPLTTQILIDCLVISVSLCLLVFFSWIIPSPAKILLSFRQ